MKRLLTFVLPLLAIPAFAEYPFMNFTTVNGDVASLNSEDLQISVADGKLIAHNASQSLEIPLTDLDRFSFSSVCTGVSSIATDLSSGIEIYTLSGIRIGSFESEAAAESVLPKDIYISRTSGQTKKIAIK